MTRRKIWEKLRLAAVPLYGPAEARSIAELLCEELYGFGRIALATVPEAEIPAEPESSHGTLMPDPDEVARQVASGMPAQYIAGRAFFYGRWFRVRPGVLIPRPETEELARWITEESDRAETILDIGTGSGCIAVTLAAELPAAAVSAVDISETALETARENAGANKVKVALTRCDILRDKLEGRYDVIVSNPPYVTHKERAAMHRNVLEYEPAQALFVPDDDPLLFYRAIARQGKQALKRGGALYFEINEAFGRETIALLLAEGYAGMELRADLSGKPRIVKALAG